MSRESSSDGTREQPVWHSAQQWLEEDDELDMDYHPALEGSDDDEGWDDDAEPEDDEMGLGISDGIAHHISGPGRALKTDF